MQELLCEDNPNLESAPINMRENSKLLVWCLEMQQKYKDVIDPKIVQRDELHQTSNKLQSDISAAQMRIQQLEKEIAQLQAERPNDYIYYKGRVMTVLGYLVDTMVKIWRRVKQAISAWRERRQTHPLY